MQLEARMNNKKSNKMRQVPALKRLQRQQAADHFGTSLTFQKIHMYWYLQVPTNTASEQTHTHDGLLLSAYRVILS